MLRNTVLGLVVGLALASLGRAADPATVGKQWVAYGQQQFALQQYDKAISAFSSAAKADPRNAAAWKGLGNVYYAKKDYNNALKYYKYSYSLNPQDAALGQFVAKLAPYAAGASAAAAQGAQGAKELDYGNRYYAAKKYDFAIYYYKQSATLNPRNAKTFQGMGNAYYAKGDKSNAVDNYKRALALDPSNASLRNFLTAYAPEALQVGGQAVVADGPKDWVQPLWRSAVLPGWGQFYNGQSTKGLLLGGLTLGMWGAEIGTYMIGSAAKDKYLKLGATDPQSEFDSSFESWKSMAELNHIFFLGMTVMYGITLVDAVIFAKPKGSSTYSMSEPPDLQAHITEQGGMGMKYRLLAF